LNEARRRFRELPPAERKAGNLSAYLALAMVAAAETYQLVGLPDRAKALLDEAGPLDTPFVASAIAAFTKQPVPNRQSEEPLETPLRRGGQRGDVVEPAAEGEEDRIDFKRAVLIDEVPPSRVPNGGASPTFSRDHFFRAYVADSGRKKVVPGAITAGATEA